MTEQEEILHFLTPNKAAQEAHAVVFPPLAGKSEKEKDFLSYLLYCRIVEKSLEAQYANQAIVVQNDGSWTSRLNLVFYLANMGMHGDHLRPSFAEKGAIKLCSDVKHTRTCYLDILESSSTTKLRAATNKLLAVRKQHRTPFKGHTNSLGECLSKGKTATNGLPTTAVFISATNPNQLLYSQAENYGAFLAQEGHNFVWGAGDSPGKGMCAPYSGYHNNNGPHMFGATTPTIATIETKNGEMPAGCHHTILCPSLAVRESYLHSKPDILAGFPGGSGTVREVKGAVLIKKYLPTIGKAKDLILHSPDLHPRMGTHARHFWEPLLPILLGKEAARDLVRSHTALADQGIYYSTSLDETKAFTRLCAEKRVVQPTTRSEMRSAPALPAACLLKTESQLVA